MAQYLNMYKIDLNSGTAPVVNLKQIYYADIKANRVGVLAYMNGAPATLAGTCSGSAILADGSTVPMTGVVSGNQAYVDLVSSCYSVEGIIKVFVKLTTGGVTTTLLAAVGTVKLTETGTVIDPGTIIPSVSALITSIEEAVDSIPADYSALLATIAPTFSASKSGGYKAGDYVWYSGTLYQFTADHTGSWTGTDAAAATVADGLSNGMIRYDRAQELTGVQMARARANSKAAYIQDIAPEFSSSTAYEAGDYVTFNGYLYRFTADHAAGAWSDSDTEAATVASGLSTGPVLYNKVQSLNAAEKSQARANIGAAQVSSVDYSGSDTGLYIEY